MVYLGELKWLLGSAPDLQGPGLRTVKVRLLRMAKSLRITCFCTHTNQPCSASCPCGCEGKECGRDALRETSQKK